MTSRPQFNMTLLGQLDSKANVVLTCFQIEKNQVLTDENKKLKDQLNESNQKLGQVTDELNLTLKDYMTLFDGWSFLTSSCCKKPSMLSFCLFEWHPERARK